MSKLVLQNIILISESWDPTFLFIRINAFKSSLTWEVGLYVSALTSRWTWVALERECDLGCCYSHLKGTQLWAVSHHHSHQVAQWKILSRKRWDLYYTSLHPLQIPSRAIKNFIFSQKLILSFSHGNYAIFREELPSSELIFSHRLVLWSLPLLFYNKYRVYWWLEGSKPY